ncbi:MAG: hypothetical protein ACRDHL_03455, partial [Candidatus Promineifilaceae bacterium]
MDEFDFEKEFDADERRPALGGGILFNVLAFLFVLAALAVMVALALALTGRPSFLTAFLNGAPRATATLVALARAPSLTPTSFLPTALPEGALPPTRTPRP